MSYEERLRILRVVDLPLAVTATELRIPFRASPEPPTRISAENIRDLMSLFVPPEDAGALEQPRDFAVFRDERLIDLASAAFRALAEPHTSFVSRIAAPSDPDLDLELARHGLTSGGLAFKEAGFDREVRRYRRAGRLRRAAFVRMLRWADITMGSLSLIPMLTAVVDPIKEFKEASELLAEHEPLHRKRRRRG